MSRLSALLDAEKERIARLWAKRLAAELHEDEVSAAALREPLGRHVAQLARLLRDRPEDVARLWPEYVRAHGAGRFVRGFDADDVVREMALLQEILLARYAKAYAGVDTEAAQLLAQLCGEATAAVVASFVRAVRTEEVRFREAGTMESILHHVEVGILLAGRDGAVTYVTPAAAALFGVPARALLGARGADSLKAVLRQAKARHPDGQRFRLADMPFTLALERRQAVRGVWMVLDRPSDGAELSIEMSASPLFDEGAGTILGVLQTLTDRTETAKKARELSDAYDALRRLQGRLLQRTRQQALGQLASSTAHALNNFLNVLRLRLTLLRRDFSPHHLDALDRAVGSLVTLVSRLQQFSVHRQDEEPGAVELEPVVREALESLRPELQKAEPPVTLESQLGARGRVNADPTLLRELLVNLSLAARDRMTGGGALTLRTSEDGHWLSVDIEHPGSPYSAEELAQMFDPLKPGSGSPQLALLLAIGRGQVQRWGGELWCENRAGGVGATFHLRFAAVAPVAEPPPRPRPIRPRVEARRVLVLDDEAENARMLADVLREEGYEPAIATDAAGALALWQREHFDAALLDAVLPETSGWDVARELRERSPDALIAMVTGGDIQGQSRATLALVDAVFRKPVDVGALDAFLGSPTRGGEPASIH